MPTRGLVEALRVVKDEGELDAIRRAAAISDAVYAALANERLAGRTEAEVAWWIERTFREHGADALAFGSIVAAGTERRPPARAAPGDERHRGGHARHRRHGLRRRRLLLRLHADVRDRAALVAAHRDLRPRRPGAAGRARRRASRRARGADVDAASRTAIAEAGFADAYGHGLGHGVGLEIHEAPTLRPESTDVLAAGNVVTVEPGLYLPGVGGCRIEDLVVVTEDGCEILTSFTKELLTLA